MINQLLIGMMTATGLLFGMGEESNNLLIENEPETLLSTPISEIKQTRSLDITERLLYMMPAVPEPEESVRLKATVKKELEERESDRATKEAEKRTEEERERATQAWETNFPVIQGNTAPARFINEITRESVEIAHRNGIYPSVMIAQAGLESNWGRSGLARNYNNLMGTKGSWQGNTVKMRTREDIGGQSIYINAGFSVYASWGDSLERYGQLLRNGISGNTQFYAGTWLSNADTYEEATAWLQGRYATDTKYASKLNRTIEQFGLERFDAITPLDEDLKEIEVLPELQVISMDVPDGFYEIQKGDSLFGIALTNDVSINDLLNWNALQTPLLEEGQWLALKEVEEIITVEDLLDVTETTEKEDEEDASEEVDNT